MPTLREIGEDLQALEDLLAEVGGDVTDEEAEAAIDAWLREAAESESQKLDRYADLIDALVGRARLRREEAERISSLASTDENTVKRLKNRLLWYLSERGVDRIDTQLHRIVVANNGGRAPLLLDPAADLEAHKSTPYVRVRYEWDTDAIREGLERGDRMAEAIAQLGERGKHVRVK
jgi:hypothetical protein